MAIAPQGRYLYVAAGYLGILVFDAVDPRQPVLVESYQVNPQLRAMQVIPVGNLLFVSSGEGSRVLLLDIGDPVNPQPLPGGDFNLTATPGATAIDSYSSNLSGGYAYFARQSGTGGLVIYDIKNPRLPQFVGAFDDSGGLGGYVFIQEPFAFVGNSAFFSIYDVSERASITRLGTLALQGDMDTLTPIGNVAVLSVDDGAVDGQASAIAPWTRFPDTKPPRVTWTYPTNEATGLPRTSRFGVTLSEAVDPKSAWRSGAVRLYPTIQGPAAAVAGDVSAMDTIVNYCPAAPLLPNTDYTLEVVAGGIEDYSGNALVETFVARFTTGG
jgi:hypothetical protein